MHRAQVFSNFHFFCFMSFNMYRFLLLVRRQFSENWQVYALGLVALAAFWVILLMLELLEKGGTGGQREVFRIGMLIGSIILAHHQFHALSNVPSSIRYLHLPASAFEKILTAAFTTMLVFPIAAVMVFYAVEIPIVHLLRAHYEQMEGALGFYEVIPVQMLIGPVKSVFFCLPFLILGAVYFRKYAFVKTAVAFPVLLIAVLLLNQWLARSIISIAKEQNRIVSGELFESVQVVSLQLHQSDKIALPETAIQILAAFLFYFTPAFVWFLSWCRLRETEVA